MLNFVRGYCLRPVVLVAFALVCMNTIADAKTKRLDSKLVEFADVLAKDREASFMGEDAMPIADFQEKWTAFTKLLDKDYAEHTVKLRTFGADVQARKVFTHLIYLALRVAEKAHLDPSPALLVSRHTFLQDLTVSGACYTGGHTFPKKMKDLLKPRIGIQTVLRGHIDDWESKYRKKFEKEYGKAE